MYSNVLFYVSGICSLEGASGRSFKHEIIRMF